MDMDVAAVCKPSGEMLGGCDAELCVSRIACVGEGRRGRDRSIKNRFRVHFVWVDEGGQMKARRTATAGSVRQVTKP